MKRICVYGREDNRKSATVANLAASIAVSGKKTAVISCGKTTDATRTLTDHQIPTVLEAMGQPDGCLAYSGFRDILCMNAGAAEAEDEGQAMETAVNTIRNQGILRDREVVIYDAMEESEGGWSAARWDEMADEVFLVTTCDYTSLDAVNHMCRNIEREAERGGKIRLSGIIYHGRSNMDMPWIAEQYAARIGSRIIGRIPMSQSMDLAAAERKTVVERFPADLITLLFHRLAEIILEDGCRCIPTPLTDLEMAEIWRKLAPVTPRPAGAVY